MAELRKARVEATETLPSPIGGAPCVLYDVELTDARSGELLARERDMVPFEVVEHARYAIDARPAAIVGAVRRDVRSELNATHTSAIEFATRMRIKDADRRPLRLVERRVDIGDVIDLVGAADPSTTAQGDLGPYREPDQTRPQRFVAQRIHLEIRTPIRGTTIALFLIAIIAAFSAGLALHARSVAQRELPETPTRDGSCPKGTIYKVGYSGRGICCPRGVDCD